MKQGHWLQSCTRTSWWCRWLCSWTPVSDLSSVQANWRLSRTFRSRIDPHRGISTTVDYESYACQSTGCSTDLPGNEVPESSGYALGDVGADGRGRPGTTQDTEGGIEATGYSGRGSLWCLWYWREPEFWLIILDVGSWILYHVQLLYRLLDLIYHLLSTRCSTCYI